MSTPTDKNVPPVEKPAAGVTTTPTTQAVNVTPPNPAPNLAPGMPKPNFKKDDFVNHPGSTDGTFGAGVGKVVAIEGDVVTVECDWQGKKHNSNFKESDLTAV